MAYIKSGIVVTFKTAESDTNGAPVWLAYQFTREVSDVNPDDLKPWVAFGNGGGKVETSDTPAEGGKDALSSPIRSMSLPEPRKEFPTDSVIIAKSVLATGCTAISLTRKAVEMYNPRNVIIASIFYSDIGIAEMLNEISTAQIFTFGKADSLDENGMLIPGVGNLDQRLNA